MIQNLDELIDEAPFISEIRKSKVEIQLMNEKIIKNFDGTTYSSDYDCQACVCFCDVR
jgi:hypothetical protein